MSFLSYLWAIPLLPLAGFLINGLAGKYLPRRVVAGVACLAVLLALGLSAGAVLELGQPDSLVAAAGQGLRVDARVPRVEQSQWDWLNVGHLEVEWGYALDPLSAVMLLIICGVGFLIHLYSIGYMAEEEGLSRYFAYLNLFMAMMLVLVLADNFLVMFVGWEGVGLCSYLLIGFNYRDLFDSTRSMTCADAGRKAFMVNRMGDYGFMLGMLLILGSFGSLSFQTVFGAINASGASALAALPVTAMALLLFAGATGKSAQIPLYVWLPDAMAGPTPVSALIHAATMVTAGVYMVCRCATLFLAAPEAMSVVAAIGAGTALLAALIGCVQNDIKKVLAYSTVSQLGYMFLAAGLGAFSLAIFHVMTHAFFKALLFLGAGSVIHAMGGEQDLRRMGRLGGRLPWTAATFVLAAAALSGLPPAAGFFSKDAILAVAFHQTPLLWAMGTFTAGLTAFYIWRLVFLAFFATDRVEKKVRAHLHEAPWSMRLPLVVLAFGAVAGGLVGVPAVLARFWSGEGEWLPRILAPVFTSAGGLLPGSGAAPAEAAGGIEWVLMITSILVALAGVLVAWLFYHKASDLPRRLATGLGGAYRLAVARFRVDELYGWLVLAPYRKICHICDALDRFVVDLVVNLVGILVEISGHVLKLFQSGVVSTYALGMFLGVVVVLYLVLFT